MDSPFFLVRFEGPFNRFFDLETVWRTTDFTFFAPRCTVSLIDDTTSESDADFDSREDESGDSLRCLLWVAITDTGFRDAGWVSMRMDTVSLYS